MGRTALAVDFGSSNTAAAYRDAEGGSHKIQLSSEGFLMPSAVFVHDGGVLVGRTAVQAAMTKPDAFEASPKRRLADGDIVLGGEAVPVTRLIAAVLTDVLERSKRAMRADPDEVILTHPDTWASPRQELLADAAALAGVERRRIRLVSEATSAAWYYTVAASQLPRGSRLAVFDFGAGTCDVAVLDKHQDETFVAVAADGIEGLGGQDLDARIYAWVRGQISESEPALVEALDAQIGARLALLDRIREAKEALSEATSASIVVAGSTGGLVLQLSRDEFQKLIGPDVDRAVKLARYVLADAEKRRPAASPVTIYLTGGSSAVPLVQARLSELGPVGLLGDPKTVVAQGALLVPLGAVPLDGSEVATVVTNPREILENAVARTLASIPKLTLPPAGWYPDPRNPRVKRYWTGKTWGTGEPSARRPAPPSRPAPPKVPAPFAETQVAALPIFPRSNPGLSTTAGLPAQTPPTTPPEKKKLPPLPEKPPGRAALGDRLHPVAQAGISALLLVPTVGLLFAFDQVGTASDFVVLWQWQAPSTAWFVAPYLYLIGAILVFGRTARKRRDGALIAVAALAFHMGASAALASMADATPYLRLVYGTAGVVAICAWAAARRRHRSWLAGLVLAVPAVLGIRYVDEMVTINGIGWIAVWIQYFGSFVVGSVLLWAAEKLGTPQGARKRR